MASIEAWGGPSGNSFPLIQTVSAGATPESLARCANAASVRPAAIIPAKARRENMSCSYGPDVLADLVQNNAGCESTGSGGRQIGHGPGRTGHHLQVRPLAGKNSTTGGYSEPLNYEHDIRTHLVCDGSFRAPGPEGCGTPFRE